MPFEAVSNCFVEVCASSFTLRAKYGLREGVNRALEKAPDYGLAARAGKPTLTRALSPLVKATAFNGDEVRANLSRDLGFSLEDRIEHARRMGRLCDSVVETGAVAIADFVCPTEETCAAFGKSFIVWIDRVKTGRFDDTNRLFVPPSICDIRVDASGSPEFRAERICSMLLRK